MKNKLAFLLLLTYFTLSHAGEKQTAHESNAVCDFIFARSFEAISKIQDTPQYVTYGPPSEIRTGVYQERYEKYAFVEAKGKVMLTDIVLYPGYFRKDVANKKTFLYGILANRRASRSNTYTSVCDTFDLSAEFDNKQQLGTVKIHMQYLD